jgi:hypothetical protein
LLNKIHFQASIGQVKRGAHPPNAAAHDKGCGWLTTDDPGIDHLH